MATTAGERRSKLLLSVLAGLALAYACDPTGAGKGPQEVEDALAALLADVGPKVVRPALARAIPAAATLSAKTAEWSAVAADSGDTSAARAEAQDAWMALMAVWQELEVMQLGPAASSLTAVGGEDRRDAVYSWPTINRCRVDQETVYGEWNEADFFETRLVNAYGLSALETLLFAPDAENTCPSQVDINADGTWDALGEAGVDAQRAAFATVLAEKIEADLFALDLRWDPAGDDYSGALANAGDGSSPYESQDAALSAVFNALFYLELATKDQKLGEPLGLQTCDTTSCLEQVETTLAGGSDRWIIANLQGFRALYGGGDGAGVDDLLIALDHAELATAFTDALDEADTAAAAQTLPIDRAATEDLATATAVYEAVKKVTDLLKGDLATTLALELPEEGAGDND